MEQFGAWKWEMLWLKHNIKNKQQKQHSPLHLFTIKPAAYRPIPPTFLLAFGIHMGPLNIDFWGLKGNPRAWSFFFFFFLPFTRVPQTIKRELTLLKHKVITYQKLEIWELIFLNIFTTIGIDCFSYCQIRKKSKVRFMVREHSPSRLGRLSRGSMRLFMSHPQSGSRETDDCWSSAHSPHFIRSEILPQGTEPQKFKVGPHTKAHPWIPPETRLLGDLP